MIDIKAPPPPPPKKPPPPPKETPKVESAADRRPAADRPAAAGPVARPGDADPAAAEAAGRGADRAEPAAARSAGQAEPGQRAEAQGSPGRLGDVGRLSAKRAAQQRGRAATGFKLDDRCRRSRDRIAQVTSLQRLPRSRRDRLQACCRAAPASPRPRTRPATGWRRPTRAVRALADPEGLDVDRPAASAPVGSTHRLQRPSRPQGTDDHDDPRYRRRRLRRQLMASSPRCRAVVSFVVGVHLLTAVACDLDLHHASQAARAAEDHQPGQARPHHLLERAQPARRRQQAREEQRPIARSSTTACSPRSSTRCLTDPVDQHEWIHGSIARSTRPRSPPSSAAASPFLATVGSTAPFVGLFGTVIGIYRALIKIGASGQASIDKVAGPVGEALIMTALGLLAAVPAVLAYNWLLAPQQGRRSKDLTAFANDVHGYMVSGGAVRPGATA